MGTIKADAARAAHVFGVLIRALRDRSYPYERMRLPQDDIPEEIKHDPLVHARFLFYACHYMRGAIQSDMAVRQLVKLYTAYPDFFDPQRAMRLDHELTSAVLQDYIDYHALQIGGQWIENSKRLAEDWGGDPRAIFRGVSSSSDVYHRVVSKRTQKALRSSTRPLDSRGRGFPGFQEKMAGMLSYFLIHAELIDSFVISPPVDFHNLRVLLATKSLRVEGSGAGFRYTKKLVSAAIKLFEGYLHECNAGPLETRVSSAELADATWLFSKSACAFAIGNVNGGDIDWGENRNVRRFSRVCGACPLESICTFNVPAEPYYTRGVFTLREREKPLLLFDHLPIDRSKQR